MGRHALASKRRTSSVLAATVIGPIAVLLASAGDVQPQAVMVEAAPAPVTPVAAGAPCCLEVVSAPDEFVPAPVVAPQEGAQAGPAQLVSSSRWRTAAKPPELLPAGLAPESGLQIKTILVARAISKAFPEITSIGGHRSDPLPWHPNGLAIDVMIPNSSSASGIALGNEIVAFVLKNAKRFGMQDAIWRGVYYTPGGPSGGGAGHFDHVHITTTGGGYPTGAELYYR